MKITRYTTSDLPASAESLIPTDSFFSSGNFLALFNCLGGTTVYWVAESTDGPISVLPGVEFGTRPIKRFQAGPDGCYGKIFFRSEIDADRSAVVSNLLETISQAGYTKIHLHDYYSTMGLNDKFEPSECQTLLADISDIDWLPPDKKLQSEIRKAEREKSQIVRFDPSVHFDRFMGLMIGTETRHGRDPKYNDQFLSGLAELAESHDKIIWYWCEHEGRPVSSHINLIDGTMAFNWQVYFDKEFSFLKANQLMLVKLAREARRRGAVTLNFGASPPDADSLQKYKEKWGGERFAYRCLVRKSTLGRIL